MKRKRRTRDKDFVNPVFMSSNSDGTNDSKGQLDLEIGSETYESYKRRKEMEKTNQKHVKADTLMAKNKLEAIRQLEDADTSVRDAVGQATIESINQRNNAMRTGADYTDDYIKNRRRRKKSQYKSTKKSIEHELNAAIPGKINFNVHINADNDFKDETYDNNVNPDDFAREAMADHSSELKVVKRKIAEARQEKQQERIDGITFKDDNTSPDMMPSMRRRRAGN